MANASNSQSKQSPLSIYVGNLSFDTTEDDLGRFFDGECGNVNRVRIIYDHNTQRSRGFGFVHFNTSESYQLGLNLNRSNLNGREIRVSPAESNNASSSTTTNMSPTGQKTKTHVVHCKKSPYDVYIGRPSDWGNPFVIGKDGDRDDVIRKYRQWIMRQPDLLARAKKELRGQRIACWCKPEACHGDVLAEIADADG